MLNRRLEEREYVGKKIEDISEELELVRCDLHNRTSERDSYERELNECLSQQKEFIKYLEDEIKTTKIKYGNKLTEKGYIDIAITVRAYQYILQKYKSIIGDDK